MGRRTLVWLTILASTILFVGCAAKSVPLASSQRDSEARSTAPETDRAAVFVIRPEKHAARASWFAVAVNGFIAGWNANGTYYRFDLPPGEHELATFPSLNLRSNAGWATERVKIRIEKDRNYYFHHYVNGLGGGLTFVEISESEGRAYLNQTRLAQYDARGLKLDSFKALFDFSSSGTTPEPVPRLKASMDSGSASYDFSGFLEGLAAVFVIGLVVAAAAYGHSHSMPMYVPPSRPYNPPALVQQIDTDRAGSYNLSGDRIIGGMKSEEWKIRGRKIIGSNGTEYTINSEGTRISGNNGQSYQFSKSGRRIDGSDGSYCEYRGYNSTLKCEAPR
jgi:hypothetical protein